jgi:serine/threonine protein kinase
VSTVRARRNATRNAAAAHRALEPHWNEATDPGVRGHPGLAKTSVDVLTVPGKEDNETNETTATFQVSELTAIRPARGAVTEADDPRQGIVLAPGGRVGKYELREKLGMGTFGLVFTARDTELERDVALKVLNPTHITNRDVLLRFLQEARASARISHPGIVTVFDCGRIPTTFGETAFITMELLGGESLTSRLHRSGRLAPEVACEIARQVASALGAAHRADVLHRDLKPDNIHVVPDPAVPSGERIKVIDFGLAKLGRHGHTMMNIIFGTPRYMSPEQCRSSGEIDQRSDVYALGCILFELVTGRPPFDGDLRQLIERHQRAKPARARSFAPGISVGLDELIDRMLAKDPADRPQSMGAVQRALEALGAVSAGAAAAMLPKPALVIGSPQQPPVASEAELLVPVLPPARPRTPNLMLPPKGQCPKRTLLVASAVAFVVAALVTAIATRAPAVAGNAAPQRPAAARTSGP